MGRVERVHPVKVNTRVDEKPKSFFVRVFQSIRHALPWYGSSNGCGSNSFQGLQRPISRSISDISTHSFMAIPGAMVCDTESLKSCGLNFPEMVDLVGKNGLSLHDSNSSLNVFNIPPM